MAVALVVHPGAAASSARVPESRPIPRATVNPGGLISGEYYTAAPDERWYAQARFSAPDTNWTYDPPFRKAIRLAR